MTVEALAGRIGLAEPLDQLRGYLDEWRRISDPELADMVDLQLDARTDYVYGLTSLGCHMAVATTPVEEQLLRSIAASQLMYGYVGVVDDVLDRSRYSHGQPRIYPRFGLLPTIMTSAYLAFCAGDMVAWDRYSIRLLAELGQRIAAGECLEWSLRHESVDVETWRRIAGDGMGAVFEGAARLATRDHALAEFGRLLGILYQGALDVADEHAPAVHDADDDGPVTRGIVTLTAAVETADAERVLDDVASDAEAEAHRNARTADPLVEIVRHVRALSEPRSG